MRGGGGGTHGAKMVKGPFPERGVTSFPATTAVTRGAVLGFSCKRVSKS